MKNLYPLMVSSLIFLLAACSPHPTSGVWKAIGENDYGIDKLVLAFDGKAHFTTTHKYTADKYNADRNNVDWDNAEWHCFWITSSKTASNLKCAPSTNPDREELYTITIDDQGFAQLKHNDKQIAVFTRLDENPSLDN